MCGKAQGRDLVVTQDSKSLGYPGQLPVRWEAGTEEDLGKAVHVGAPGARILRVKLVA